MLGHDTLEGFAIVRGRGVGVEMDRAESFRLKMIAGGLEFSFPAARKILFISAGEIAQVQRGHFLESHRFQKELIVGKPQEPFRKSRRIDFS
jgi:hypothetical protein